MTRPLLILAALLALIGSWLWWRQAPAVGPLTSAPQQYVGHGGTDITFGADSVAAASSTSLTCANCTTSTTSVTTTELLENPASSRMLILLAPSQPEPEMILTFGNQITLKINEVPIAWIEKTGGKSGRPRVRIRDGRVADAVRALVLMTLWQARERGMTPEVEEWAERLKK